MTSAKDLLRQLVPGLAGRSLDVANRALEDLQSKAKKPLQREMVAVLADAVDKYGPDGIEKAKSAVDALLGGKDVDLDFLDMETASDLLAAMQNAEADEKSRSRDILNGIGNSAGKLIGSMLRGMTDR